MSFDADHTNDPETARIIVVIPCYNEAKRLQIGCFTKYALNQRSTNIIFVDDGSTDNTGRVIHSLCESLPDRFFSLHLDENSGKGEAVRHGILLALSKKPDIIGFWDADLSAPLREIDRLASIMAADPYLEAVFGVRVQLLGRDIQRKHYRHYIGRFFATLFSMILRIPVYDTQCGTKLFRCTDTINRVFSDPFLTRWLFDVEILARLLAHRQQQVGPTTVVREEPLLEWKHVSDSKIGFHSFFQILSETCKIFKLINRSFRNCSRIN